MRTAIGQAPEFDWAKQGASRYHTYACGTSVATDNQGNIYQTGYFAGSATYGSTTLTSLGDTDIFVVKYDSSGNVLWARQGGGPSRDNGSHIAVDAAGNCYVSGAFYISATFDNQTISGYLTGGPSTTSDIFIAKYDAAGNLQWVMAAVSAAEVVVNSIAVDAFGYSYITGSFITSVSFGNTTLNSNISYNYEIFLAKYDSAGTVVWAQELGGGNASYSGEGTSLAVDNSGNCYLTATFSGTAQIGVQQFVSSGFSDVLLAKLSPAGAILWATRNGGASYDKAQRIALDQNGNIYVAGTFYTSITFGTVILNATPSGNGTDIFLTKFDNSGNVLWARKGGGPSNDEVGGLGVDSAGNAYITGTFYLGTAAFGSFVLTAPSISNRFFLVKYNGSGIELWAQETGAVGGSISGMSVDAAGYMSFTGTIPNTATFGNHTIVVAIDETKTFLTRFNAAGTATWANSADEFTSDNLTRAMARDAQGNLYVTGGFKGTLTLGTTTLTSANYNYDLFVAKYDSVGNVLWAIRAGGTSGEVGVGIAVDGSGNCFVTGSFGGAMNFGTVSLSSSGSSDVFLAKYDASGNLLWARKGGGVNPDYGYAVGADAAGNSYIFGTFVGNAQFTNIITGYGGTDMYLVKYNPAGTVQWVRRLGSNVDDWAHGMAVDAVGNCYLTGAFKGYANFGGINLAATTFSQTSDVFVAKFNTSGTAEWVTSATGTSNKVGKAITLDAVGDIYITGDFEGSATFGNSTLVSTGNADVFVAKYTNAGTAVWAKQGGSPGWDSSYGIAVDALGNSYIVGQFSAFSNQSQMFTPSVFFPTLGYSYITELATFGSHTVSSNSREDMFVAKYDAAGNNIWAKSAGGTFHDMANGIAVDPVGNSFITGHYYGSTRFGDTTLTSPGKQFFLSRLNANSIGTNLLSGLALCSGSTVAIPFSGLGNFHSSNVFTAQLSGTNGNFDNPVSLGVLVGPVPGTIVATVPVNLPAGTGYRIRIVSSSPAAIGSDNGFDLSSFGISANISSTAICIGTSVQLAAAGGLNYSWLGGNGLVPQTAPTVMATPTAAGMYTYTVISNSGCTDTAFATLTVYPSPPVSAAASFANICAGQSTLLTATGASTYNWNPGNLAGSQVMVTPLVTTIYTVTGTSAQGCEDTASFTISVNQAPLISAANVIGCSGSPTTLNASGPAGTSYTWSGPNGFASANQNPAVNATLGTNTYTVTGTLNGCSDSTTILVTGIIVPQVSAHTTPDSISPGQLLTLIISNPDTSLIYTWSGPNLNQTTGDTVTANPSVLGTQTYTVTASNGACSATATASVVVDASLLIQIGNWNWAVNAGGGNGKWANSSNATVPAFARQILDGETGVDIAADAVGNTTTLGRFKGTATFGNVTLTSQGPEDMVLIRANSNGQIQWVKQSGGLGDDEPYSVAIDATGNAYICGAFSGSASFGSTNLTASGAQDAFLVKYLPAGDVLWARNAGGSGTATATDVTVNADGDIVITGFFSGSVSFGTASLTSEGNSDAFVVKYSAAGNVLWAKKLGGTQADAGSSIATDSQSNIYITGTYSGSVAFGVTTLPGAGSQFGRYYCKLDQAGNVLWAKATGISATAGNADVVAVDASGNSYVSGNFSGVATFGTTTLTAAGGTDLYLLHYSATGDQLFAKRAGGTGDETVRGIAVDQDGLCYLTGSYTGHGRFGDKGLSALGADDIFVAKFDMGGNCMWARKAGGVADDAAAAIAVDGLGNSYLTGNFRNTATFGLNLMLHALGQQDLFIAKLSHIQALGVEDVFTANAGLLVFPNPFSNDFTLQIPFAKAGKVEVRLLDVLGRNVLSRTLETTDGEVNVQFQPGQQLPQGLYLLQVRHNEITRTIRLIKH